MLPRFFQVWIVGGGGDDRVVGGGCVILDGIRILPFIWFNGWMLRVMERKINIILKIQTNKKRIGVKDDRDARAPASTRRRRR